MKNDISFILASSLNLYEHQSTFNPNMPIRGFLYFARLYEAYIEKYNLNIYGRKQISLPTPQYIVFYNGKEDLPDESLLNLSDAFVPAFGSGDLTPPTLECTVHMFNINPGHNQTLLKGCRRLHDYSIFISEINQNLTAGLSLEDAIYSAIDSCINKHILEDILSKSRNEVFHMLLTKYDEKKFMKITYQEGVEEGSDRVNQLNCLLAEQNRTEDIIKAAKNKAYQKKLFQEFHIK